MSYNHSSKHPSAEWVGAMRTEKMCECRLCVAWFSRSIEKNKHRENIFLFYIPFIKDALTENRKPPSTLQCGSNVNTSAAAVFTFAYMRICSSLFTFFLSWKLRGRTSGENFGRCCNPSHDSWNTRENRENTFRDTENIYQAMTNAPIIVIYVSHFSDTPQMFSLIFFQWKLWLSALSVFLSVHNTFRPSIFLPRALHFLTINWW